MAIIGSPPTLDLEVCAVTRTAANGITSSISWRESSQEPVPSSLESCSMPERRTACGSRWHSSERCTARSTRVTGGGHTNFTALRNKQRRRGPHQLVE